MVDDPGPNGQTDEATGPVADAAPDSITAKMAGWFGVGLTGIALVAFVLAVAFTSVSSLGFAALTGTGVLSLGLISLIVLSRAVGVATRLSALGLPPGSIRALLALGLAIVFVSVASWTLGGLFDPLGQMVTHVTVPSDQVDTYRKRYPEPDYVISETQLAISSGPPAATAPPPHAELKIYLKKAADSNVLDLAKQILTISATILVTVVGFYFGSNSSAEAVRGMNETITRLQGSSATPKADAAAPRIEDLQQSVNVIGALTTAAKSKLLALGDDPMSALAVATGKATNKEKAAADLIAAQKAFTDLQNAARAGATDADRAREAGASIRPDMPAAELVQVAQRLQQLLGDAHQAADVFETKLKEFTSAQNAILQGISTN